MRKTLSLLLLATAIFASESIIYGGGNTNVQTKTQKAYKKVYSVRFLSVPKNTSRKRIFQSIPKDLRDETRIVPSGNYLTAMFTQRDSRDAVLKDLAYIKEIGYKDAYIRSSQKFFQKTKAIKHLPRAKQTAQKQIQEIIEEPIAEKKSISKFTRSRIIYKANDAYKKGDYMQAIIFYEMLVASGNTTRKVRSNLCYLYGRVGAFLQAEEIIDSAKYPAKLIYSYAYGAATTGQENFYSNLSKYIPFDKSGKLMLLSGYYFEMKHEQERSLTFYKMAYEQNPVDSYNLYAYARAEDIVHNLKSALTLYKKIVATTDKSTQIYKEAEKRIYQIGN